MGDIAVKIKQVHESAIIPKYQTPGSAGMDLHAVSDTELWVGESKVIPIGICISVPPGYEAQIRPRSGLAANRQVTVLNSPGTIDCFSEDSVISTLDGRKLVHDLKINHVILSFNEKTHEIQKDIITAIVDIGIKDVIMFTLEDETVLSVTPGTLIYTNNGLKAAKDLTFNDQILIDHDI